MPVYESGDYEKVIARIKKKVEEGNIKMGVCLSEETIIEFEKRHEIQLPQGYRMFLKYIGNGCDSMVDGFRLKGLEDIKEQELFRPFMLEEAWVWENDDRDKAVIAEERNTKVYCGEFELIDVGCCMSYNLIVTGKCQGEVWNFSDVGVQPCCERQDFLGWFELWLDNQDETDYFKDYVYDEI